MRTVARTQPLPMMDYGFHTDGAAELEEAIENFQTQKTDLVRQYLNEAKALVLSSSGLSPFAG